MFGFKLSELIGQNVTILMEPSLRAIHHDFMERFLRTREARVLNTRDRRVVGCSKGGRPINRTCFVVVVVVVVTCNDSLDCKCC
jgi:hypothetical protein